MNIVYTSPIDNDDLKKIPEDTIDRLSIILFETRNKIFSNKIIHGNHRTLEEHKKEIRNYCKNSNFLMCAYDGDKCVAFRFIISAEKSKYANPKTVSDKIKYQKNKDWWISQGLSINQGYIGHYALDKDYHGQGIMTELRNRCNEEAKQRGFKWVTGYGIQEKSLYEYTMNYYKKCGYEPIFSDIKDPIGYGNIYYYLI